MRVAFFISLLLCCLCLSAQYTPKAFTPVLMFNNAGQSNANRLNINTALEDSLTVAYGETVNLINNTRDGSSLGRRGALNWSSSDTTANSNYNDYLNDFHASVALNVFFGNIPDVRGMTWIQGEGDTNDSLSIVFESNLESWYKFNRRLLSNPDLLFIPQRLNSNYGNDPANTNLLAVRAAVEAVSTEYTKVVYLDQDSITLDTDFVHYTPAGYLEMLENLMALIIANN